LPILKKRAVSDTHLDVRHTALQELTRSFKNHPDMFEVFYHCAMNDPFKREYNFQQNPRQLALETIIEEYPHHPQTIQLLSDRANNDPDEQVREFADQKLRELDAVSNSSKFHSQI
jgi:hypothetical protein